MTDPRQKNWNPVRFHSILPADAERVLRMGSLIFISEALVPTSSVEMARIYLASRRRNRRLGVTSHLHHEDGIFLHYFEGPPGAIETLLLSIRCDWRHRNMRVLHRGPPKERLLTEWMGFSEAPEASFLRWMGGAPDGITPEQMLERAEIADIVEFIGTLQPNRSVSAV
ncbi:BLUF domain-containing protein [Tropicimonas sp. IMCC6043]|uniref:BLUF domain-containing protein n=1 Tax=Tropicimonas sp. IMCC6043 TaxID=2510645 RepID=UPI0013ED9F16|nr:BLUF domain-containing protein [Tropicimonas sp. IMCC6043]